MSTTAIDKILWRLHFEAERSGDYYARIGADTAAWYIGTGEGIGGMDPGAWQGQPGTAPCQGVQGRGRM